MDKYKVNDDAVANKINNIKYMLIVNLSAPLEKSKQSVNELKSLIIKE